MHCPTCRHLNYPGTESCGHCGQPLTPFDAIEPHDRIEQSLMTAPVSLLNPRPPVTLPLDAPLSLAMRTMAAEGVGAILVVGGRGSLAGILTERDFLTKIAGRSYYAALPVRDFMTPEPVTVAPSDSVAFALGRMDAGGYRHLPVVDADRPVGVISVRDILRFVTGLCKDR